MDPARRHDKPPRVWHLRFAMRAHRHETVVTHHARPAREDGRMVLAAALSPDACDTAQRLKAQAVLDAPEIPGQIFGAGNGASPFVASLETGASNQCQGDRDDKGTRTAQAGRARQVAGAGDVGAEGGPG